MNKEIKECAMCGKFTQVKETPSGFEVCKECWDKYKVEGYYK